MLSVVGQPLGRRAYRRLVEWRLQLATAVSVDRRTYCKEKRITPSHHQLCLPKKYTSKLLNEWHSLLGHYSSGRLLPTLRMQYWWPTILTDVKNVSKNGDICQRSKIIGLPKQNRLTLNPWPVPTRPWELVSMDHKKLSRKTTLANTHILVFCDHFSGEVIYCPVPSETAFVTAQAFVREIVARKGTPLILVSDRASGYMSIFFRTVTKLLGVRHWFTAALSKQSNGRTENAIKQLNAGGEWAVS